MSLRTEEQKSKVRKRRMEHLGRRELDRVIISLFVCWHLLALVTWAMPKTSDIVNKISHVNSSYMTETGFMQGWLMFAPDPSALDIYLQAKIHYADGSTAWWYYPRMSKEGLFQKYREERYRKYLEFANLDANSYLWPPLARYAARASYHTPSNPPVRVELIRYFRFIPPPGRTPKADFTQYSFYSGNITPGDLK